MNQILIFTIPIGILASCIFMIWLLNGYNKSIFTAPADFFMLCFGLVYGSTSALILGDLIINHPSVLGIFYSSIALIPSAFVGALQHIGERYKCFKIKKFYEAFLIILTLIIIGNIITYSFCYVLNLIST